MKRGWSLLASVAFSAACAAQPEHEHEAGAGEYSGCPVTVAELTLGMRTKPSNDGKAAVLREASPIPALRFLNDWTVDLVDAEDEPLEAISLVSARAFMPVHGHYGTPDPTVTKLSDERARFALGAINFFMRGPWEVRLTLARSDGEAEQLVFETCVKE